MGGPAMINRMKRLSSKRRGRVAAKSSRFEPLERRCLLAGDIVISEFMASNQDGLIDEDGHTSDWIELHNTTAAPVDLQGWFLTDRRDNLTRWQFPSTTIAANGYLIVF